MKLSKRETIMIVVGFILVSVVAYVFYFLMPQMSKQQSLLTQTLTARSNVQTLKAKAIAIESFKNQIASLQSELDQKTQNIPHGSNDAIILMYVRQLADRVGVDVRVAFADTDAQQADQSGDDNSAFERRVVAVDLVTTYAKLNQLLAELNKVELFNDVQIISAKYEPQPEPSDSVSPAPTATAAISENSLNAHIEIYFDAFKLLDGENPSTPPLNPNIQDRTGNMFPN